MYHPVTVTVHTLEQEAAKEDEAGDDDSSITITPTSTEPADKIDRAYDATT